MATLQWNNFVDRLDNGDRFLDSIVGKERGNFAHEAR